MISRSSSKRADAGGRQSAALQTATYESLPAFLKENGLVQDAFLVTIP
jgi:hypothetical protein